MALDSSGSGNPRHSPLGVRCLESLQSLLPEIDAARDWISCLMRTLQDVSVILDLNYNFKPEGYIGICEYLADLPLFWVEIDSLDAKSLKEIRDYCLFPICSG